MGRRLTHVIPAQTMGPLQRYSGKLYGSRYLHVVEFLSMKHRLTKASVRALLESYWRYVSGEVERNGQRIVIPGIGALEQSQRKLVNVFGTGNYQETTILRFQRSRMGVRYLHQEDDEWVPNDDEG